jgi:hypothetical protein
MPVLKRLARALALAVDHGPVRFPPREPGIGRRRNAPRHQRRLFHRDQNGPEEPSGGEAPAVPADGALGHAQGQLDLALAPALVEREAQRLPYPPHRDPLGGHSPSANRVRRESAARVVPSPAYRAIDISGNT